MPEIRAAIDVAVAQVRRNLPDYTYRQQNHSSVDNFYPAIDNNQWTAASGRARSGSPTN